MINKRLIHFNNFSKFNTYKLSVNENNTKYTVGINGSIVEGSPDISYQCIVYIKDTKQHWTHGLLYNESNIKTIDIIDNDYDFDREVKDAKDLTIDELIYFKSHAKATYMSSGDTVEEVIDKIKEDYKTYNNNLAKKQDELKSGTNIKTINGESLLGSGNINIPKIIYLENEDALPSNPDANTLYVVGDEN